MDRDYAISSGLVERYALGQASCEEAEQLELLMGQDPELRDLVDEASKGIEAMALASSRKMPADLSDRVMRVIRKEVPKSPEKTKKPTPIRSLYSGAFAAAAILAAALLATVFYINSQRLNSLEEIASLEEQNQELLNDRAGVQDALDVAQEQIAFISKSSVSKVQLETVNAQNSESATVYWDDASDQLYIDFTELPALGDQQQYQLWAIVDAQPLSMGVLSKEVYQEMISTPSFENPAAFAITIEVLGGSEAPSLDQMRVIGNA